MKTDASIPDPTDRCREALPAAESLLAAARRAVGEAVLRDGRCDPGLLEGAQFAAHGFAWLATYVEALRQSLSWAERLDAAGGLGETESLILQMVFGEYLAQMAGGIAVSQVETVRPADIGVAAAEIAAFHTQAVESLIAGGNTNAARMRLAALTAEGGSGEGAFGDAALGDESLVIMRDQFRRLARDKIAPEAQGWHLADRLIPLSLIEELASLGVFGLTMPEAHGGLGQGKIAMCVVTEELSRASLAVGSLATRSEIAGELIAEAGTEDQKSRWLAPIARGEIIPAAVFTEPDVGSDLGAIKTRAVRKRETYRITGAKTWATHAARADMMTLLVRTGAPEDGNRGLSMFLAPKPRGDDANPFPAAGMSGEEIRVLGYRGMKEYTISFDGFEVPAAELLGGVEGQGFRQLMTTFESARIQTAARAVGVAQSALDHGLDYALGRSQFGKPIHAFPRVAGKLAWMAVETMVARQLVHHAARQKDSGRRCDIEAGMAKLLSARVAWASADASVQIHGGVGYAEEYPISRILVDARILNIFEGAAEIQAHIIARGLLERRN